MRLGPREVKSISGGYIQPLALTDLATRLLRSDETVYGRELARLTGISPGTLHRELQALTEMGLLTRREVGRQFFYSADQSFPLFEDLTSIMRKTAVAARRPHAAARSYPLRLCVWLHGLRRNKVLRLLLEAPSRAIIAWTPRQCWPLSVSTQPQLLNLPRQCIAPDTQQCRSFNAASTCMFERLADQCGFE